MIGRSAQDYTIPLDFSDAPFMQTETDLNRLESLPINKFYVSFAALFIRECQAPFAFDEEKSYIENGIIHLAFKEPDMN